MGVALRAGDFAAVDYARGGAEFLRLQNHAQSAGLGGAVTAWRENLAGSQYNPAIIEANRTLLVSGSNTFWPDDRKLYSGEATASLGEFFVLNAGFTHAGVDGIERRNVWGTLENYFSDAEDAVSIAAAGRLKHNIAWGLRGRYLSQRLADETARGMGFDAGATWEPTKRLCAGLSVLNIASRLFWSTGLVDQVIMQARLGVVGKLLDNRLSIGCDVAKPLYQPIDVALGVQFRPIEIVCLRGGISTSVDYRRQDVRSPEFSLGAGMRHSFFGFDYSATIPAEKLGILHRISVTFETAAPIF
jgi:hypothetical protein